MPKKHHVFLSYSRVDTDIMKRVKNGLRQTGLKVWTDEGIVPGTPSWKEAIEDAIRETEILVVLMSPDSNKSVWVQREMDYADVQGVQILSMLVRGEPRDSVPFALAGSQFIELRTGFDDGIKLLISQCYEYMQHTGGVTIEHTTVKSAGGKAKRRRLPVFIGGSIVVLLVVFALLFSKGVLPLLTATETPTNTPTTIPTTAIAIAASDTPTQVNPTATRTPSPTVPTAMHTSTNTPDRTPTPTDTVTPSPSPTPSGALQLRYDANTLVVYNRTDSAASILGLEFVLITENGNELYEYAARSWGSAITTLAAGQCLQVWRNDFTFLPASLPPANICRTRRAFSATINEFWIADWENAYFEVRRFGILLTTCSAIPSESSNTLRCVVEV